MSVSGESGKTVRTCAPALLLSALFERFAFYAIRATLLIYAGAVLFKGEPAQGIALYTGFLAVIYLANVIGGYLADAHVDRRVLATTALASYLVGTLLLCVPEPAAFRTGLAAIAIGAGFYRPVLTATVSLAFAASARRESMFLLLYFAISLAALLGPIAAGMESVTAVLSPIYTGAFLIAAGAIAASIVCLHIVSLAQLDAGTVATDRRSHALKAAVLVVIATTAAAALLSVTQRPLQIALLLLVIGAVSLIARNVIADVAMPRRSVLLFLGLLAVQFVYWTATEYFSAFASFATLWRLGALSSGDASTRELALLAISPLSTLVYALLGAWLLRRGVTTARSVTLIATGLLLTAASYLLLAVSAHLPPAMKAATALAVASQSVAALGDVCIAPLALALMTRLAPMRWISLSAACWFALPVVGRWFASLIPAMGDVSPELAKPVLAAAFLQFCCFTTIWFVFSRSGSSGERAP